MSKKHFVSSGCRSLWRTKGRTFARLGSAVVHGLRVVPSWLGSGVGQGSLAAHHDVEIPRLASTLAASSSDGLVDEDACYRAMDWLHDAGQVAERMLQWVQTGEITSIGGKRIRLQIRQALSGELKTVEITLPPDFAVGKPIRLRGLGKRVGPWQGDLYLIITNE